jgi:MFS family permease
MIADPHLRVAAYRDRRYLALTVAAAVSPLVCFAGFFASVFMKAHGIDSGPTHWKVVLWAAWMFFCVGFPLAFLVAFPAAMFVTPLVRDRAGVASAVIIAWYTLCGAIVVPFVEELGSAPGPYHFVMRLIGIIAGLAGGACFCLIALNEKLPRAWETLVADGDVAI